MDPSPSPKNLTNHLLIADPSLQDQIFKKSVILLSEHQTNSGASGFILNHPTAQTLGDLIQSEQFNPLKNLRVYIGGPISQQNLTFAALWRHEGTKLRYATRISAKTAIRQSQQSGTIVRAFAGYAQWTEKQLEEEIEGNSWIITKARPEILGLSHERSLWAETLRSMSPFHKILAETPDDIFVN